MASKGNNLKASVGQLEDTLNVYLVKKAPFTIPDNIKELIVKLAPWFAIIAVILSIPGILLALGLGALVAPFSAMLNPVNAVSYGINYTVAMVVLAVSIVLEALAIPGLFSRSKKAWNLVFYASLINAVSGVLSGGLIGTLIGVVISLYILFQVREYYK